MYQNHHRNRAALSLVEMLMAMAVVGILAVGLGSMAFAVHETNDFVRRRNETLQHARVALQRIERTCRRAVATADHPGFWTVSATTGGHIFPDALVVWSPESGTPTNADGPPLISELVIYTYDAKSPGDLLEITARGVPFVAPPISDTAAWLGIVEAVQSSDAAEIVRLSDLLRVANAGGGDDDWRGVILFQTRYHPTATEWNNYQGGSVNWEDLTWPLGWYGADYGVRQSWCAIELQLVPRGLPRRGGESQGHATAFFGSATREYTLEP